jgi:hypothetical protein
VQLGSQSSNPIESHHPAACHVCGTAHTLLSCRTKSDVLCYFVSVGCVIAHSVTCQPFSADAQLQSKTRRHEHSGTETGSSSSVSVFFCQCHSISPIYSPFIPSVICHWRYVVLAVDGIIESTVWTNSYLGRQWDWELGSLI